MVNALSALRNLGVEVRSVIDIGVHKETPFLIKVFPDVKHSLIEPSGEFIDAKTAFKSGLVADVVEAGKAEERALELALAFSANAPISVRLAKDSVLQAEEMSLSSGLHYERKNLFHAFSTLDRAEGMAAFEEKRNPEYREE